MSGPAPRRAIKRSGRRLVLRSAAPAAIVAGLVATGLTVAMIPSPTSATGASMGADTETVATHSPVPATAAPATAASAAAVSTTTAMPGDARLDTLDFASLQRRERTNRGATRKAIEAHASEPKLDVTGTRYATVALNVRTKAAADAKLVTVLKPGVRVKITDTTKGQWRLIVRDGKGRWVKKKYLATKKPDLSAADGAISSAPCSSGNAVESGLTPDAIKVHRALCARFPQVSAFGGVRQGDGGEHGSGRAVDAMISDSTVGWRIAKWVRANAKRLGVSQVIYSQHIWTVQRGSEGWRSMSDRGSATANHYDHVHVTVYGNAAG